MIYFLGYIFRYKLSPDDRDAVQFVDDPQLAYVMTRDRIYFLTKLETSAIQPLYPDSSKRKSIEFVYISI